ncbi:MAG: hypothetical protein Q8O42_22795 [Acidobacteriota bacterium]|nr:hypothetical protein [Acidobacteriota bacterium]
MVGSSAANSRTGLTATCAYPPQDVRDLVVASGMAKNDAASYDCLEDFTQELQLS